MPPCFFVRYDLWQIKKKPCFLKARTKKTFAI